MKLLGAAFPALAAALRGTMSAPVETRGSVYFTARTAAKCLRSPAITEWVTPPAAGGEDLDRFDPAGFVRSRQSLYLLSKDGGGSAPLVAALTDRVLRAAVVEAEAQGGRLDPPLVAVLDEAANICRIGDLPALYSHLGSRGVVPVTILQSYAQAVGVWGESGTKTLYGAATVKLIGSGMDDASFAEDVPRLVGEHDVTADSWSSGNGRSSRTRATRTERIPDGGGRPGAAEGDRAVARDRRPTGDGADPAMACGPAGREHHRGRQPGGRPARRHDRRGRAVSDADAELRAWVARLEDDLAELRATLLEQDADRAVDVAAAAGVEAEAKFEPVFGNVEEWVSSVFAPVFARHEGAGARWCVRWWDHGEAVLRLEALWRSWEALRLDPILGMSRWLRDYLDPQLAVLTSATGPFQSFNAHGGDGEHYPPEPLRVLATPEGYWQGGNL